MVISYCAIICWFVCCTMYSYENLEVLGIWPEGRVCWKHHKPFQLCYSTHLSSFDWVGLAVMPSRRSTKQFCKLAAQAPNFSLKLCANADNSAKTGLFFLQWIVFCQNHTSSKTLLSTFHYDSHFFYCCCSNFVIFSVNICLRPFCDFIKPYQNL